MKQNGGEVIGSGSYGCVFKPPLKCKNKTRKKRGVSKLMLKENGFDEILIGRELERNISSIKNYKKYFIIPNEYCFADKQLKRDEIYMQKRCDKNIVMNYYKNNELLLNTQLYGGKNLHEILKDNFKSSEKKKISIVKNISSKIKDILINGINPMHKISIYHTDIKPQNLVSNKKTIKLIDWGLAYVGMPEKHINVIHFNRPYESILLGINNDMSKKEVEEYIKKEVKENNEIILNEPIRSDLFYYFMGSTKDKSSEIIIKYIKMIADFCYTKDKFNKKLFVKNYYEKQDYWGLLYFYIDVLKTLDIKSYNIKIKILELCSIMVSGLIIDVNEIIEKLDVVIKGGV